jgi:hypothetical protein
LAGGRSGGEKRRSERIGYTVFSQFEKTLLLIERKIFMFNFRVADLRTHRTTPARVSTCRRRAGAAVRKFGWIIDPDGNKIELWEPPDVDDPFGEGGA